MSRKTRTDVIVINKQLRAGLADYYGARSVVLAGKAWPCASVVATLQEEDTMIARTAAARAAWRGAVAAARVKRAANDRLRAALRAALLVHHGDDEVTLAAFGIAVTTPRKPPPEVQAAAVQKRLATRVARGTLGKRQRKALRAAKTIAPAR